MKSNNTKGTIISFYSFKGGTGRTMTLANIATWLTLHEGKKVLMLDWDLEAPGLLSYFAEYLDSIAANKLGLIDFFIDVEKKQNNQIKQFIENEFYKYVTTINIAGKDLHLVKAGNIDVHYSQKVQLFNWRLFFESKNLFFGVWIEYLQDNFDFILIDSRTGLSDISGICTMIMPEKIVTVFTPNSQSTKNLLNILKGWTEYRLLSNDPRPYMIYPLPSRVEINELELYKHWQNIFLSDFEKKIKELYNIRYCDLKPFFDQVSLSYIPKYAYGERISVIEDGIEEENNPKLNVKQYAELAKALISDENIWAYSYKLTKNYSILIDRINEVKILHLDTLDLSGLQLLTIPHEVRGLTHLKHLNLSNNRISITIGIEQLANLETLDLSSNEIEELKAFDKLSKLIELNLSNNDISNVNGLNKLASIIKLNISNNKVEEISSLFVLVYIQELLASDNLIESIDGIELLTNLKRLDISSNKVGNLKPLLSFIQNTTSSFQVISNENESKLTEYYIDVFENPISTPPMEVIREGTSSIMRYFQEELTPLLSAKILVVGEPEAGKTSLVKKLLDPTYKIPNEENSTIGISISKWAFNFKDQLYPINVNIWDFGGQEIQYLTHQFFLTTGALYILVISARKDFDNLDYWLNIVSVVGGSEEKGSSEILIIANEINMSDGQAVKTFDFKRHRDLYPHLRFEFYSVNLATVHDTDGRFRVLQEKIKEKIQRVSAFETRLPVKWAIVRQELATRKINYIVLDEYFAMCKEVGVGEKAALDLSNYMHKIGEALHFQDDKTVDNFIILNPQWVVDAIYGILTRKDLEANGGYFTQQQVYGIWEGEGYSFGEKGMLLNLMVKDSFEVAYKIPNRPDEYIAPQLLPLVQPDFAWDRGEALHFRYLYSFMPKGIITRLIVRMHEDIKYQEDKGLVWRSGVFFEKLGCIAKVEETKIVATGQQVIAIEVTGHASHRKLLLYDICRTIEGIHKDAFSKIVFERQVPCNCSHCQTLKQPSFFEYGELMQYIDDEIDTIRCKLKPKNEVAVAMLLKGIFELNFTMINLAKDPAARFKKRNIAISEDPFGVNKPQKTMQKIFISYSKHDEEYKEEFRKHLVTLKEQKLISSFNCKEIDLGADWDETIQREIDECDIMICLVSVDFLNTEYIRKYEVEKAMANGKQVIPIIIKPCDWEPSNIGKLFAPNRGKNISLDQDLFLRNIIKETSPIERAAWWVKIIQEMREKLFK